MTEAAEAEGDAHDATVEVDEDAEREAQTAEGFAVQRAEAEQAVQVAKDKLQRAKADVDAAKDAVAQAQADLDALNEKVN